MDLGELGETVAWVRIQGMEWEWMARELEVDGSRDKRNGVEGEVDTLVDSPIPISFTEQLIM